MTIFFGRDTSKAETNTYAIRKAIKNLKESRNEKTKQQNLKIFFSINMQILPKCFYECVWTYVLKRRCFERTPHMHYAELQNDSVSRLKNLCCLNNTMKYFVATSVD